jgi:hypothetical protein
MLDAKLVVMPLLFLIAGDTDADDASQFNRMMYKLGSRQRQQWQQQVSLSVSSLSLSLVLSCWPLHTPVPLPR